LFTQTHPQTFKSQRIPGKIQKGTEIDQTFITNIYEHITSENNNPDHPVIKPTDHTNIIIKHNPPDAVLL